MNFRCPKCKELYSFEHSCAVRKDPKKLAWHTKINDNDKKRKQNRSQDKQKLKKKLDEQN